MFWILIQGLESKSIQKQADLWGDRSSRGPKLLRGESELLWGMGTRPVTHPLVHLVDRHSLRAYYVPRAVQTRKAAVGKTDKTLALEECTFFFLFRRKMRSGTISIAFSKGSNRPKFTLFNSSPIPFIENHTGLATWTWRRSQRPRAPAFQNRGAKGLPPLFPAVSPTSKRVPARNRRQPTSAEYILQFRTQRHYWDPREKKKSLKLELVFAH